MAEPMPWEPRGVLHSGRVEDAFRAARFAPCAPLADVLAHIWAVSWDLRDAGPRTAETLPHPTFHAVFEEGRSGVSGPTTERFVRALEGRGRVLGLKFHPGCFRPLHPRPAAELADRVVPLREALGPEADALEAAVLACGDDAHAAAELAEDFLVARLPAPDPDAQLARRVVQRILEEPELRRAQDVADATGMGLRTLQRLFREYVGVSPKWVVQRYRLHEAVARLDAGGTVDLAQLALELGFAHQAHFHRAFKALVGRTPGEYVRARQGPS